jgi:orotidine-5'-phosphate decarboxylase
MISFQEKIKNISQTKRFLCVGLDPRVEQLPAGFSRDPESFVKFCQEIISATAPYAGAFKPNMAYFECFGSQGLETLKKVIDFIPKDKLVILDAKRGDIGETSRAYARMAFEHFNADSITLSPYMGFDSLAPFFEYDQKGSFLLCLTSNPSAKDFELPELYLKVARKAQEWNQKNNIGLVVGATQTQQTQQIRSIFSSGPFLIPGVGAQGGDLEQSILKGRGEQTGAIPLINASRSILFASKDENYAQAAAREAQKLADQIIAAADA